MALSPTSSLVPVRLLREGRSQPWGVRLAGGCDLGTPIVITRVSLLRHNAKFSIPKVRIVMEHAL